jgi:hypothetical protein
MTGFGTASQVVVGSICKSAITYVHSFGFTLLLSHLMKGLGIV